MAEIDVWSSGPQTFKHLPQSPFIGQFFKMTTFCIAFYSMYKSYLSMHHKSNTIDRTTTNLYNMTVRTPPNIIHRADCSGFSLSVFNIKNSPQCKLGGFSYLEFPDSFAPSELCALAAPAAQSPFSCNRHDYKKSFSAHLFTQSREEMRC